MLSSLRKWSAVAVLLGGCGYLVIGLYLLNFEKAVGPSTHKANVFIGSCLVGAGLAVFGLITRRTWGRWLGLATGVCGLSCVAMVMVQHGSWTSFIGLSLAGASALLILLLSGSAMAAHLGARGNPFVTGGSRATLLSLSVVLSLAATPTLWGYALLGHRHETALRAMALVAAGLLCLGALLIIWQRTAGLLALLVGGGLGLTVATYAMRGQAYVGWSQGAQWLLAGAGALLAVVATARPVCRVLAGKPPIS